MLELFAITVALHISPGPDVSVRSIHEGKHHRRTENSQTFNLDTKFSPEVSASIPLDEKLNLEVGLIHKPSWDVSGLNHSSVHVSSTTEVRLGLRFSFPAK